MKVSIDFEITNCGDCPFLTKGRLLVMMVEMVLQFINIKKVYLVV